MMCALGCSSQPGTSSKLGLGGDCQLVGASGCVSGFCAELDTGASVCSLSCNSDLSCPGGWTCRDDRTPALCVPAANSKRCEVDSDCPASHRCAADQRCVIPVERAQCVGCTDDLQCAAGLVCASAGEGLGDVCLRPCVESECGDQEQCQGGACVPVGRCGLVADLCASCRRDSECGGRDDYCVRNLQLGRSFCARDCSEEACPEGFRCQAFEFGEQCVPADGRCQDRCLGDVDCPAGFACGDGRCAPRAEHRGLCAPCGDNGDCADGVCVQGRDGRTVCAPTCGPEDACPNGASCGEIVGTEQRACLPRTGRCPVGVGATGRRCGAAEDCASGLCLRAEDEQRGRCVNACAGRACPGGQECAEVAGVAVCIDRQGADGAPCSAGVTCRGGLCVTLATESICSRACDAQTPCPQDWSCRAVSGGREACLPATDGGGTGAMCQAGAAACTSGLCLMTRSGPVCTQSCADTSDCPDGWGCLTVEGRGLRADEPVCVPSEVE